MNVLYKIDKFLNHPDYQIIIASSSKSVRGLCLSELSFSITADYSALHDVGEGRISRLTKATSRLVGSAQISLKNLGSTIADWQGNSDGGFNFEILFVATQLGEDPRKPAEILLEMVSPQRALGGMLLKAPNGYAPNFFNWKSAKGTVTIRVGRHFSASNMLLTNVSYTSSKELTQDGWPLYVKCSVTARYFRMITAEDVPRFFISP